jgi:hypothetical protein
MAFIGLRLQDASHSPAVAEPWGLACNTSVATHPLMVPEDGLKAGPATAHAVHTYR